MSSSQASPLANLQTWTRSSHALCFISVLGFLGWCEPCYGFSVGGFGGLQIAGTTIGRQRKISAAVPLRMKVETKPEFTFFDKATEETFRVKRTKAKSANAFASKSQPKKGKKGGGAKGGGFARQTASLSPEWAACRSWIEKCGGKAEVDIREVAPGLRGAVATSAMVKGDVIFSIPRSKCILDEQRADGSAVAELWQRGGLSKWDAAGEGAPGYNGAPPPAYAKTALLLLWLGRAEEEEAAEWGVALRVLPSRADFEAEGGPLVLWEEGEVAQGQCGVLARRGANRREAAEQQYHQLVAQRWARCPALAALPAPTLAEYKWAVAVVTSRVYGGGEAGAEAMLIPGVDQANHQHPARANSAKALAPWGDFVVVATRGIRAGAEVLSSYGPKDNRELLEQFGFMLPPDDDDDTPAEARPVVEWLRNLKSEALPSAEAVEALCERQLLLRSSAGGQCSPVQPVGPGLREACAEVGVAYSEVINTALGAYATSAEEDEAALAGGGLGPRERLALEYRLRQKRILQAERSD